MSEDPYIDPATGILRNLTGAVTAEDFDHREAQIAFANELELESCGIKRSNDFDELLAIHKQLFKGIFDWAGTPRTVDIKKNGAHAAFFLPKSKIQLAAQYVFTELAQDAALKGLALQPFIERLAYHYDQLNYIHPFREGNGRAQRIFWSRVAHDAGYAIDWSGIIGNENNEASRIAAEDANLSALIAMLSRITTPLNASLH